jgi:hypothetical protein
VTPSATIGTYSVTASSYSSTQSNLGLSVGYKVAEKVHLIAEYDFSNGKYGSTSGSVSLLSFGIRANF